MAFRTKYRECLIYIGKEVIEQEQAKGKKSMLDSEPLATTMPTSNRVKKNARQGWGNSENIYLRIKNSNMLLMHIKKGYCVIVPEYVHSCSGGKKSIIEHMSTMYFTYDNKGEIVSSKKDTQNRKLYRKIMALKYFGSTTAKLIAKSKGTTDVYEVHHKFNRWLNTEEAMKLVNKKQHSNIKEGQKSHRDGRCIWSAKELENFLNSIKSTNEDLIYLDNKI
jgi:hypothetical protein